jgi:hypothetical protein
VLNGIALYADERIFMAHTNAKDGQKNKFVFSLIFPVLLGGIITLLCMALSCKTENSAAIKSNQVAGSLPAVQKEPNKNDAKETTDKDYLSNSVKQIESESFQDTLLNMTDWDSNYLKIGIGNMDSIPASPASLKLIIYSRRFAKLIEHGREGLTEEEKTGIVNQLKNDLAKWKKLWNDGQKFRGEGITGYLLHSPDINSEDLIVPLTFRINSMILLAGALYIDELLPLVIECVDTIGEDTNWSAVGYACDKILNSLDSKKLNTVQKKILNEYQAWQSKQYTSIFEYDKVELPSYKSSRRPFERATSPGANEDISAGKVSIEMPLQYLYITLRQDKGYYDPTGISEVQKKVIDFAKAYSKTKI